MIVIPKNKIVKEDCLHSQMCYNDKNKKIIKGFINVYILQDDQRRNSN